MKKRIIFHLALDIFHLVICRSVRDVADEVSTACVSRWVKASTPDVFGASGSIRLRGWY